MESLENVGMVQRGSVKNNGHWNFMLQLSMIDLQTRTPITVACMSALGTVIRVRGVTLVFDAMSRISNSPPAKRQRAYETEHIA